MAKRSISTFLQLHPSLPYLLASAFPSHQQTPTCANCSLLSIIPPLIPPPTLAQLLRSVAPISIKGTSGCMKMISRSAGDAV